MKKYLFILAVAILVVSCKENKTEKVSEKAGTEQTEKGVNLASVEVSIEGMTCEIGCAKLIESKLSKTEGVTYSKVNFESKTGQFTYDTSKLSKEDISKKIAGIAGGDLYSVVKSTEIDVVSEALK